MSEAMYHKPPENPDPVPKTVTLSRRDLADAKRLLSLLVKVDPPVDPFEWKPPESPEREISRSELIRHAKRMFLNRRRRVHRFGKAIFGEPAWDMLLALYVMESTSRLTVSRLTAFSGTPQATALRWLEHLEGQGFVSRSKHPNDRRVAFVGLTDTAREALDAYFSETLATQD